MTVSAGIEELTADIEIVGMVGTITGTAIPGTTVIGAIVVPAGI